MADTNHSTGKKWGQTEKAQWLSEQSVKRSYHQEVMLQVEALSAKFEVVNYGALSYDAERYPLFILKNFNWEDSNPTILITGGVHGYETSGVQGALKFLATKAEDYTNFFNFIVAPCVSPWGYETINRWNPLTLDPNRSFYPESPAEEAASLMRAVAKTNAKIFAHFDLHETTDTDNTVFRPALAARDGVTQDNWNIPDGFYTVGDAENPQEAFQGAIIDSVRQVTHIAPADENGQLIGVDITQEGVINYPVKSIFLCTGFSDAEYCTTTEVYPDSPLVNDEDCKNAQVAAVVGGLDYLLSIR
ncbi:M14 family metallocarboxypeptidase [Aliikangiella marina]|uniref:M14 family metallocarboxypeptidase n=1 Tax=Aliikangiella marina TaxID=1712262 RepID=A0A545THS8_9GAMM|nr:M14 family metallocarboxypeptidase [Aliikangiella marina]TQV76755.1 M14 family metallocarboxypeptidase [Aliikangiella marina]